MDQRLSAAIVALCAGAALPSLAQAQLRVVTWNITSYNGSNRAADLQTAIYGEFSGRSMSPDMIGAQEFVSAGALTTFVAVLNSAPGSPGDWAAAPFITGPDTQNVFVYRTSRVNLVGTRTIALGSSSSSNQPRNTYRYDVRPVGYTSPGATLALYPVHLKAGSTATDEARRLVETGRIRSNASGSDTNGPGTGLPPGYHFIVMGDFNIQRATDDSYVRLTTNAAPYLEAGRVFDPIRTSGTWNNSSLYRFVHTQDPATSAGMDDRFDFIMVSAGLIDGEGFEYIGNANLSYSTTTWNDPNHSYRSWGNDGTSFNTMLTTTGNTMVGPTIAQALRNVATTTGGHLPVLLDLRVPPKVTSSTTSINFGTVAPNAAASTTIQVSNAGDVAQWNAAGIANLTYTLTASAGFTAPAGSFSDAAGGGTNSHTITMNTSTAGPKSGTVTITSNDPDQPTRVITVTGTVAAANQPPIADAGPDQILTDTDNSGNEMVTLDGSGSSDPDGTITNYRWSVGGTILANGPSPAAMVSLPVGQTTVTLLVTDNGGLLGIDTVSITINPGVTCGSADFDGDGDAGTDSDIEAFFACLAGNCCPTCGTADFDGDGDSGTDSDIEAFFRVLAGGNC